MPGRTSRVFGSGAKSAVGTILGAVLSLSVGCSPADYRRDADRETYQILSEKASDPRWSLPDIRLERPLESRLHDPDDPDHPPLPPDDPAAHRYMLQGVGEESWTEDGKAQSVEHPAWRKHLPLSDAGALDLDVGRAVELALLHSREYQFQLENLYLAALDLTLERFDFSLQWFAGNFTGFEHSGSDETDSNQLETSTDAGFSRSLSTGGQLLVDFANSFIWEFSGSNSQIVSSNVFLSFIQPLLRRAGGRVRLEQLTQSERDVLYSVRDFARFRKRFYFDVVVGAGGFLSLLLELQGIRNLEATLASLEQNLRSHEALAEAGIVSPIQVDQVFQSHQRARLALIRAENSLENGLDTYKTKLGLPPILELQLDDSLLAPFQLEDPALTAMEREIDTFLASYRDVEEVPTVERLEEGFVRLGQITERLVQARESVVEELARWNAREVQSVNDPLAVEAGREASLREQAGERLGRFESELQELKTRVDTAASELNDANRTESWEALRRLTRQALLSLSDLYVTQTQIRVYLIELRPVDVDAAEAVDLAWEERLDLMNQRARVVDAWREIRVAADGLQGDLDLILEADIGTEPGSSNPVKFSSSGSSYRAGVQIDGPLNRMKERNIYRATLVNYQRARRAYMGLRDRVAQQVRKDLRQLRADRVNFEITRQSLITAARQVEQAREQLMAPGLAGDSSSTQDVLDAVNSLLETKNSLIGIWVSYETDRLQLLLDMEALALDETGFPKEEAEVPVGEDSENENDRTRTETD